MFPLLVFFLPSLIFFFSKVCLIFSSMPIPSQCLLWRNSILFPQGSSYFLFQVKCLFFSVFALVSFRCVLVFSLFQSPAQHTFTTHLPPFTFTTHLPAHTSHLSIHKLHSPIHTQQHTTYTIQLTHTPLLLIHSTPPCAHPTPPPPLPLHRKTRPPLKPVT